MTRLAAAIAAIWIGLAVLTPAAASSQAPQHTNGRYSSPRTHYYANDATAAIAAASARWGVSYGWLLRVASCESGLYPGAYNASSGATGLFQFMPGTYYGMAARIGEFRSIWNAYANANVAAYMFSIGLSYEWVCQ